MCSSAAPRVSLSFFLGQLRGPRSLYFSRPLEFFAHTFLVDTAHIPRQRKSPAPLQIRLCAACPRVHVQSEIAMRGFLKIKPQFCGLFPVMLLYFPRLPRGRPRTPAGRVHFYGEHVCLSKLVSAEFECVASGTLAFVGRISNF